MIEQRALSDLAGLLQVPTNLAESFTFEVKNSSEVSKAKSQKIWDFYSANMRSLLEGSSFGWHPKEKKAEMFHKHGRMIVVFPKGSAEIVGLLSFWFDVEPHHFGALVDVFYLYEILVASQTRQLGLGSVLLQNGEILAREAKMCKVMLTVLLKNDAAISWYAKKGYAIDAISPVETNGLISSHPPPPNTAIEEDEEVEDEANNETETDSEEEADYLILSKSIEM